MEIKETSDGKGFYVFGKNAFKPVLVKVVRKNKKDTLVCQCEIFEMLNECNHVMAVYNRFAGRFVKPNRNFIEAEEWLGGDLRKQIINMLKGLSF